MTEEPQIRFCLHPEIEFCLEQCRPWAPIQCLTAGIEISIVIRSWIMFEQRRDPPRGRKQSQVRFIDIVDIVLTDRGRIGLRLCPSVALVQIVNLKACAGQLFEFTGVVFKKSKTVTGLSQQPEPFVAESVR